MILGMIVVSCLLFIDGEIHEKNNFNSDRTFHRLAKLGEYAKQRIGLRQHERYS
ncbi:hypothetical protein CF65_00459 [Aggregatibacter actinomycetemcomitans HK1651]|nr:hypothetical protein CF65_00459 [Aggregatibacter actinomycetemcomitans HK1651]